MSALTREIGVCSWSLQPNGIGHLVEMLGELELKHVQLAMEPLVQLDDKRFFQEVSHIRASGLTITAGMIAFPGENYSSIAAIQKTGGFVPDDDLPQRRRLAKEAARLSVSIGVRQVSTHIGFIPPRSDPAYRKMISRIRDIAADFTSYDVNLLMETGQEPAEELREFLQELHAPNVFVNFDPANMILYGAGDPIAAIGILAPWIRHVHVKDATHSSRPGTEWGTEVPFGTGEVGPARFLNALDAAAYTGPLIIEREAGVSRIADVREAIAALRLRGR